MVWHNGHACVGRGNILFAFNFYMYKRRETCDLGNNNKNDDSESAFGLEDDDDDICN